MDTKPEPKEIQETQPHERPEKTSPIGISAIQGEQAKEITPDKPDLNEDPVGESDPGSSESDPDMQDITIHPNPKGLETLPSPEVEPISAKIPKEEDKEGKEPPKPPEGWRPGGPESGG